MASASSSSNNSSNQTVENGAKTPDCIEMYAKAKHSMSVLHNLNKLRNENVLCDLKLIAGIDKVELPVHKNLISASSKYFDSNGEYKRVLMDTDGKTLRLLVDFCYTGQAEISAMNIKSLLRAATKYRFTGVERACSEFLERFLDENPVQSMEYYHFANSHKLLGAKQLSKDRILKHFAKIKGSEEFLSINIELLVQIIRSTELNSVCEEDVFTAVVKWIEYNKVERIDYILKLFKSIRFTQMTEAFLTSSVHEVLSANGLDSLWKDVIKIKYSKHSLEFLSEADMQPRKRIKLDESEEMYSFVVDNDWVGIIAIEKYSGNTKSWNAIGRVEVPFRMVHAVAQNSTSWIAFGEGGQIAKINKITLDVIALPDIPNKRDSYAVAANDRFIFVLGGKQYNETIEQKTASDLIEKFDFFVGLWLPCSYSNFRHSKPITAVLREKVYCIQSDGTKFERVDMNSGEKQKMTSEEIDIHQLIAFKGKLYAATDSGIKKYVSGKWAEECKFEYKAAVDYHHSNGIFRVCKTRIPNNGRSASDHKISIEEYHPDEKKFENLGELKECYAKQSKIFVLSNQFEE